MPIGRSFVPLAILSPVRLFKKDEPAAGFSVL
jgi:hypothetical protein